MRKCKVRTLTWVQDPNLDSVKREEWRDVDATFHQFGVKACRANDGDAMIAVTVAIVEMPEGRVRSVMPTDVLFTAEA